MRSSTWFNIIPKRGPLPIQLCVGRGPFSFSGNTPRRFYGVPWPEQYAILFDLTRAAPPHTRTPNLSVEDMLRTYELAASGTLMPVGDNTWAKTNKFASVPPSRVIEAQFVNVT